jgi:glycosyltransferase involved in cell wall biosynthesis
MRIAIDMQGAQTLSAKRGVGRFTVNIAKALARVAEEHEILLVLNGAFEESVRSLRDDFQGILPQENIKVWQLHFDTKAIDPANKSMIKAAEYLREEFINQIDADIVFVPNLQEGWLDSAVTSIGLLPTKSKVCSVLHDLAPLIYKEELLNNIIGNWYYEKLDLTKRSDAIFTVSWSTKRDISKLLNISKENIFVLYCAIDRNQFRPISIPDGESYRLLSKYSIKSGFLMYAGGADKNKNLPRLIEAFSLLSPSLRKDHQLVFVGGCQSEETNLRDLAMKCNLDFNDLVFTGHVSDQDLPAFYNLCTAFILPSFHEGFGIPPLEAMACGAAVIASDAASLPEVIDYQDALFDPYDITAIAGKIQRVISDEQFRSDLQQYGLRRSQAKEFTWENSARTALEVFKMLLPERSKITSNKEDQMIGVDRLLQAIPLVGGQFNDQKLFDIALSIGESFRPRNYEKLYIDVSSIAVQDHATGIQRVTRAIALQLLADQEISCNLVYSTPTIENFYFANNIEARINNTTVAKADWHDQIVEFYDGDSLLFLDLHPALAITHASYIQKLRNKGVRVFFVVYDLLPVHYPQYFVPLLRTEFIEWLNVVFQSDGAFCISKTVAEDLSRYCRENEINVSTNFRINWFHLSADIMGSVPSLGFPPDANHILSLLSSRPTFLMVGTIEPRKRHSQTLAAFEQIWAKGVDANFCIVGRQGWLMKDFIEKLVAHTERGHHLFWLNGISDEYLEKVYAASTCLIVPSEDEGFGLPLVEAARHKLSIIARDIPVFREVASEHAFYFNGLEPEALASAIQDWMKLNEEGSAPSSEDIPRLTWKESAAQLKKILFTI